MEEKVKVRMKSNLGWIDAENFKISDATLEAAVENAEISVTAHESRILIGRLRCAELADNKKVAKTGEAAASKER